MFRNWNWLMVFAGIGLAMVEVLMGASLGFDFILVGACLVVGGGVGLLTGSVNIGLATTAILGTVYIVFFRKYVRSKLSAEDKPSNVDSILGRSALVTEAIAPNKPGQVKVGGELWRAILADGSTETKSAGENVSVISIDGVTLHVR